LRYLVHHSDQNSSQGLYAYFSSMGRRREPGFVAHQYKFWAGEKGRGIYGSTPPSCRASSAGYFPELPLRPLLMIRPLGLIGRAILFSLSFSFRTSLLLINILRKDLFYSVCNQASYFSPRYLIIQKASTKGTLRTLCPFTYSIDSTAFVQEACFLLFPNISQYLWNALLMLPQEGFWTDLLFLPENRGATDVRSRRHHRCL
jgi:hypothetical protein